MYKEVWEVERRKRGGGEEERGTGGREEERRKRRKRRRGGGEEEGRRKRRREEEGRRSTRRRVKEYKASTGSRAGGRTGRPGKEVSVCLLSTVNNKHRSTTYKHLSTSAS